MNALTLLRYCLMAVLLFQTIVIPASAVVRYVKVSGAGAGGSWAAASGDLQVMIDASAAGDEIWVAAGNYTVLPAGASFYMKDGVKIYGGFPATGNPAFPDRDRIANVTILMGNGASVLYNDPGVFGVAVSNTAVLDGFTITGGTDINGGGMWNYLSSPTVSNCSFTGNSASSYGGGMFNETSSPKVLNCTFSNNTAPAGGGGLNYKSSATFTDCEFSNNTANTGRGGGGMYNWLCTTDQTLTNCKFLNNQAASGGGVYNYYSSPVINRCEVSDNKCPDGSAGGMYNEFSSPTISGSMFLRNAANGAGGMFNWGLASKPIITGSTFSDNKANIGGGGMWNNFSASPVIRNCVFTQNEGDADDDGVSYGGGAIENSFSSLVISNSIFAGNKANRGGAMNITDASSTGVQPLIVNCMFTGNVSKGGGGGALFISGNPRLVNVTMSGNRSVFRLGADLGGGGIYYMASSVPFIANSIIHGNGNGLDQFDNVKSSGAVMANVTYSIVQGGHAGAGNLNADPLFVAGLHYLLAPNSSGNYTLEASSPAIGSGSNTEYQAIGDISLDKDLGGGARLTSTTIDMGAYESGSVLPVTILDITAKKLENSVSIEWQTTEEVNAGMFEIARSTDAKTWLKIGELAAKGESRTLESYSFFDPLFSSLQIMPPVVYYRLKMIDLDETFTYSRIVSLHLRSDVLSKVFPNPAQKQLNFSTDTAVTGYRMVNTSGRIVIQKTGFNAQTGAIDLPELQSGIYVLELIQKDGASKTHRVSIQH